MCSKDAQCNRRIFADVIVYVFPHKHTTLRIEGITLDTILLEKLKELVKLSKW